MRDDRTGRALVLPALRRFWPLAILIAVACGFVASWAAQEAGETTYTAEGQYLVPVAPPVAEPLPGEPPLVPSTLPTDAYDAGVLARTYELVLVNDDRLRAALAQGVGVTEGELADNTTVVTIPGTQVIRVTYTGTSAEEVETYFATLSALVSQQSPTPYLPTGNLVPLRQPSDIEANPGLSDVAPWAGALAGLLLGVGAAVLLERVDRRVRSQADVRWLVGWPVFEARGVAAGPSLETVVLRLLQGRDGVDRVAVVAVPGTKPQVLGGVADDLASAEVRVRRSGALPQDGRVVQWAPNGRLADDGLAERAVQQADAAVVVVPRRARYRGVVAAAQNLHDLGAERVVLVMTDAHPSRDADHGDRPERHARAAEAPRAAAPGVPAVPAEQR